MSAVSESSPLPTRPHEGSRWLTDRHDRLHDRLGRAALLAWLAGGLVLLIVVTSALGFGLAALPSGGQGAVDLGVAEWVAARRRPWLTDIAWVVTHAGDSITLLILAAVVGLAWRWRRDSWIALLVLLGAYGGALVLYRSVKQLVARARPAAEIALHEAPGLSFPSGHTTGATAVYVALALLVVLMVRRPRGRTAILAGFGLLVVLVGLSRVYLGVHWMGDVLAGWFAGTAWALVVMTPVWARRRRRVVDRQSSGSESDHPLPTTGDDQALANS